MESGKQTHELNKKLMAVQADLKAPKDLENKFGGFNYRSCEGILEAVKPLLHASGLLLTITDDVVESGGWVHVKATATISFGGESLSVSGYARESENKKGMDSSQITGSASSYARKYALNGLFLIDDSKDPDTIGAVEISDDQTKKIRKLIKDTGTKEEEFCLWLGCDSVESIPAGSFKRAVEALNAKAKKLAARQ